MLFQVVPNLAKLVISALYSCCCWCCVFNCCHWCMYPIVARLTELSSCISSYLTLTFQDPASDWMYSIIDLHDRILFYLLIILFVVVWFLVSSMNLKYHLAHLHHGNTLELVWTITPALVVWAIGIPSLRLLYLMDYILDP